MTERSRPVWPWVLLAMALLVVLAFVGCSALVVGAATQVGTSSLEPAKAGEYGAGVYAVGTDIQPGSYRTTGPGENSYGPCYMARLSGTSGGFEDIIANDLFEGPGIVTISSEDVAIEFSGDCKWTIS